MRMATIMMMPPIEGTPFFSTPKGSILISRAVSPMLRRFIVLMKYSPNTIEMTKASINASRERKEM